MCFYMYLYCTYMHRLVIPEVYTHIHVSILLYSHFISSNRWDNLPLAANESDVQVTVREALYSWINEAGPVRYVDICQGIV